MESKVIKEERYLKSFETVFIESLMNEKEISMIKKEVFYAELSEINFSNRDLNKRVLNYNDAGDSHFLCVQYFEKNESEVILKLFNDNQYGRFWNESCEYLSILDKSEKQIFIKDYVKESLPKMKILDQENSKSIFNALGSKGEVDIQLICNDMVQVFSVNNNRSNFWANAIEQKNSTVLPVAYGQWDPCHKTLLCKADNSYIFFEYSTS